MTAPELTDGGATLDWTWTGADPATWRLQLWTGGAWTEQDQFSGVTRSAESPGAGTWRIVGYSVGGAPVTEPSNAVVIL